MDAELLCSGSAPAAAPSGLTLSVSGSGATPRRRRALGLSEARRRVRELDMWGWSVGKAGSDEKGKEKVLEEEEAERARVFEEVWMGVVGSVARSSSQDLNQRRGVGGRSSGFGSGDDDDVKKEMPLRLELQPDGSRVLWTVSEPLVSMGCRVRLVVVGLLKEYWAAVLVLGVGVLGILGALGARRAKREREVVVGSVVEDVIEALFEASVEHVRDPIGVPVSGIPVLQLRDHFLVGAGGTAARDGVVGVVQKTPGCGFGFMEDEDGRRCWILPEGLEKGVWEAVTNGVLRHSCGKYFSFLI
jgi:hypothetical protein